MPEVTFPSSNRNTYFICNSIAIDLWLRTNRHTDWQNRLKSTLSLKSLRLQRLLCCNCGCAWDCRPGPGPSACWGWARRPRPSPGSYPPPRISACCCRRLQTLQKVNELMVHSEKWMVHKYILLRVWCCKWTDRIVKEKFRTKQELPTE